MRLPLGGGKRHGEYGSESQEVLPGSAHSGGKLGETASKGTTGAKYRGGEGWWLLGKKEGVGKNIKARTGGKRTKFHEKNCLNALKSNIFFWG